MVPDGRLDELGLERVPPHPTCHKQLLPKTQRLMCLYIAHMGNNSIQDDFSWVVKVLNESSGVCLLKSVYWISHEATFTIFCDACPDGMGFWYLDLNIAYYSPTPCHEHPDLMFYFEALCVHSALFDAHW